MATIKEQKEANKLAKENLKSLENIAAAQKRINELYDIGSKRTKAQNAELARQYKVLYGNQETLDESLKTRASTIGVEKTLTKLGKSNIGQILKANKLLNQQLDIDETIAEVKELQGKGDFAGAQNLAKQAETYSDVLSNLGKGADDVSTIADAIAKGGLGPFADSLEDIMKILMQMPDVADKIKIEKDTLDGADTFRDRMKQIGDTFGFIDIKQTFSFAGALLLAKEFLDTSLDIKQSLGVSGLESARIATNLKAANIAARAFGGNAQEAEAAVLSLEENFGSIDTISLGVSAKVGALTGQFGLAGDSAGKLLKSLEGVSGASLETNIELTKAIGQLARAEGVSPAKVLNDIAEDTETFAKFGKDGGRNIGQAAVQARKLGVNMATVAGIAESLLSFEESIEKQMEASVLLGRQLNLDKARELALTGDLDGLQKEIVNQVGSQADFEAMNVVQRQALADAVGVQVGDLAKIVAGDKTSAELAKDAAAEEEKRVSLMTRLAEQTANLNVASLIGQGINTAIAAVTMTRLGTEESINKTKGKGILLGAKDLAKSAAGAVATLAKGAGAIFSSFGMIPFGIGIPLAIAAVASMYALAKKAKGSVPKLETGGVVKKTGMAEVHKGEAFSGTKNEMGFGASMKETERLLSENTAAVKQLTAKHTELMNSLTGKVGEMAMS